MPTVDLTLPHHRYDIVIEPGCLMQMGDLVRGAIPSATKAVLVTDEGVEPHHARPVAKAMEAQGVETIVAVIPVSEKKKNLGTVRTLYDIMLENKLERGHALVTLGGGICGDVAGFAAATYLRGIPFVQCPTSLLAMVDASVGGKTGVNVPQGKNLIGAFHQPSRVVIDPEVLTTLSERELRCGLAECLKHGVIRDASLFDWIVDNADPILSLDMPTLVELVRRNVEIKASVVMEDEKEAGVRAHLNFGHTFAHAIEATSQYGTKYKHGEAVSLGMVAATAFAVNRKLCPASLLDRVIAGCEAVGLPTSSDYLAPDIMLLKTMSMDKKVRGGKIRLVLPVQMGQIEIIGDATADEVIAAWDVVRK
ncbi:3-dehydroquinate synthase [Algisphaera agarilytica]|uniref:3-dehydroquinate synthase n=1 Tax=Algisphaera agarilytica TaxID=1385975 RepID=A0A7X0H7B6_9BACT|nr:3-dehydroquinate synthase [Algisphaera agarilytica]MBB6430625.1 3-dehydroquinate synthase [Algisphaera agarilytica]